MTRWLVLLEKMSRDGSTNAKWAIAGVSKDLRKDAKCNIRGDYFGKTENGGPVAFVAQCIVVWECNDDLALSSQTRHIIERWANGDFVLGGIDGR